MRNTSIYLILPAFLLFLWSPVPASDSDLRKQMEHAMENRAVLQVTTGHREHHTGIVVEMGDNELVLLNPMTGQRDLLKLSSIQQVKRVKAPGKKSKANLDKWAGKGNVIRLELLDGSRIAGRVMRTFETGFAMQDPKTRREFSIEYDQVKVIDPEPTGQKVIRKVMIGVGIGLASLLFIGAAIFSGD